MRWLVCLGLYLWLFAAPVQAAVMINEIFPNPSGSSTELTEFIELYNSGTESINLQGYTLSDPVKAFTITDKTIVGYGYLSFTKSETGIGLNNSGDTVILRDVSQNQLDNFIFDSTIEDRSWSRIPDGTGGFVNDTNPTQDAPNSSPPPTPTPTPSPSPTAQPTAIPTSTASPTSTPTAKTALTVVTPKPTISPQILAAKTEVEPDSEVTVAAEVQATAIPSATPQPETNKQGKWPWLMMIGGGGLAVAALFPFLRKWYHDPSWLKTLLKGGDRSSFGQE